MEIITNTHQAGKHTVTIHAGWAADYQATIEDDRIVAGTEDMENDYAEAWVEIDGKQAHTIISDAAPGNAGVINEDAEALLRAILDAGELSEEEIEEELEQALAVAVDNYETAAREARIQAVTDMIEDGGYRTYYRPGEYANTGTLILVTDPDADVDDADALDTSDWAEQYWMYINDPAAGEDGQALEIR